MKRAILSGLLAISLLGLAPNPTLADFHVRAAMPVELEGDPDEPRRNVPLTGIHSVSMDEGASAVPTGSNTHTGRHGLWVHLFQWARRFGWLVP